ncbi:hypothetical protein EYZ11_008722 [Aspergillus tanneri]|nr:hypothetical protein EYZ11_008722 [Aspergillus tanneri]
MTVDILLSLSPVAEALQDPLTRMTVLIFLSNDIGMAANVTFKQFVSALFHWELADVNTVSSFDLIISAAVLLGLPALSTFLVNSLSATKQQVDLWVTLGSSIAKIVGELGIGLAPSGNTCFLFLMTYAFGSGLLDGLRSFATSGLEDEKSIQRLYMAISMVQEIAGFIGAPIWTSLFYATLHGNIALPKGVHFFGAAVFFMIAFGLTLRLQRHVLRS